MIKLSVFGLVIIAAVVFFSYLYLFITDIEDAYFQFTARSSMVSDFIVEKIKSSENIEKIIADLKYARDIQKIVYDGKEHDFRKDTDGTIGLERLVKNDKNAIFYFSKTRYNKLVHEKRYTYLIQFFLFILTLLLMHLIYKITRKEVEERDFIEIQNKSIELKKKVSYLETTYEVGRTVVTELVLDKLLEKIIVKISEVYGEVKRISIMLYDPSRDILEIRSSRGLSEEVIAKGFIRTEDGISGTVLKSGKAMLINSEEKSVESEKLINISEITSSMCVPIKYDKDVIGVISISDRNNGEKFDQEDLALLESLSYYVAIALNNAKLYDEVDSKLLILSSLQIMTGLINSDLESSKMFEVVENMTNKIMPEVKDIYI
ncbi:GAF domain-containing protein [bacterium]|nr:GAF domain-containing protein [bacterium]